VRLSPLGTSVTNWPIVPAPDNRWWVWSSRRNDNWQGKPKYSKCILSTTNSTRPDLGSNRGCRGGEPGLWQGPKTRFSNHLWYVFSPKPANRCRRRTILAGKYELLNMRSLDAVNRVRHLKQTCRVLALNTYPTEGGYSSSRAAIVEPAYMLGSWAKQTKFAPAAVREETRSQL
jgi:hypothetical protein